MVVSRAHLVTGELTMSPFLAMSVLLSQSQHLCSRSWLNNKLHANQCFRTAQCSLTYPITPSKSSSAAQITHPKTLAPVSLRPSMTTQSGSIPASCHAYHLTLAMSIFCPSLRPSQFLTAQTWDQAAPCSSLLLFLSCVLLLVLTVGIPFPFLFFPFPFFPFPFSSL